MARKRPDHLREVVNNAQPVAPAPSDDGTGDGGTPRQAPPKLPANCPFIPLGMEGNLRHYLDKARQLITLPVGKHNRLELMGLYGDDAHLMQQDFPRYGKEDKVNGIDAALIQEVTLSRSAIRIWSPTEKAR